MSDQITVARVLQFNTRVKFLLQQRMSRFRKAVMEGHHVGKLAAVVDQVGAIEMLEKTGRHQEIPSVAVPIARRWVAPTPFAVREFLDTVDLHRMLWNPAPKYAETFAMAAGRQIDRTINTAFLGAALTGESGTTSEAFDTTNFQIVHGGIGLTIGKLRTVREKWQAANVDVENEEMWMAIGPQQENNLLAETQMTSRDYNQSRDGIPVLQNGRLTQFLGINFIVSTLLTKASTTRSCVAWLKSGMYLGIWDEIRTPIDWIPELDSWQIACMLDIGATRVEQGRVIEVQCTEV